MEKTDEEIISQYGAMSDEDIMSKYGVTADQQQNKSSKLGKAISNAASYVKDGVVGGIQNTANLATDAVTGVAQGLTGRWLDEMAGGAQAGIDVLGGNVNLDLDSIKKQYRKRQQEAEAQYSVSQERSPFVHGSAEAVGLVAPAIMSAGTSLAPTAVKSVGHLAKAANIGKASATGAITGGAYGLGSSTGSLLGSEKDKEKAIDDTLLGTTLGGIFGGSMKAAGEYIAPEIGRLKDSVMEKIQKEREVNHLLEVIMTSGSMGKKGIDLGTKEGMLTAGKIGHKPVEDILDKFENTKSLLGKNLEHQVSKYKTPVSLGSEIAPAIDDLYAAIEQDPTLKTKIFGGKFRTNILDEIEQETSFIANQVAKGDITKQEGALLKTKALGDIYNKPRSASDLLEIKTHLNDISRWYKPETESPVGKQAFTALLDIKNQVHNKLSTVPEFVESNKLLHNYHDNVTNVLGMQRPKGKYDIEAAIDASSTVAKRKANIEDALLGTASVGEATLSGKNAEDYLVSGLKDSGHLDDIHKVLNELKASYTTSGKELPKQFSNVIPKTSDELHSLFFEPSRQVNAMKHIRGVAPHIGERQAMKAAITGVNPHTGLSTLATIANRYQAGSIPVVNAKTINKVKDFITTGGTDTMLKFADKISGSKGGDALANIMRKGAANPDQGWRSRAQLIIQSNPVYKNMLESFLDEQEQEGMY